MEKAAGSRQANRNRRFNVAKGKHRGELVTAMSRSPAVDQIYLAPPVGNPGPVQVNFVVERHCLQVQVHVSMLPPVGNPGPVAFTCT
jgi:hypothetical protein